VLPVKSILSVLLLILAPSSALAQDFSFDAFVGTWEGQYTSTAFGGSQLDMVLQVEPDGFYTDSSGYFMPSLYPNTQDSEFEADTNRLHFWYLDTVYAGMHFYQHFYYEVVSYTGNTLELHYNFWDDPEPHPQAGTIVLQRVGAVAPVEIPQQAVLQANYPNPFNPSTRIEFSLPRDQHVSLRIFDVRGREVEKLVSGQLPAGNHTYQWDASGKADGVYLYQLQAGDFVTTRKMTLVK
jgi:hypothetical protein